MECQPYSRHLLPCVSSASAHLVPTTWDWFLLTDERTLRHRGLAKVLREKGQGQDLNPGSFAAETLLCSVTGVGVGNPAP